MGPKLDLILTAYWYRKRVVLKTGKFLGKEFQMGRVLTQADPA